MRFDRDAARLGWIVVALVLLWSGTRLMWTQEVYGRVRMPGAAPLMSGGKVFLMGLAEALAGAGLLWYRLRGRR